MRRLGPLRRVRAHGKKSGYSHTLTHLETTRGTKPKGRLGADGVELIGVLSSLRSNFQCRICRFLMRPPFHLPATNDCGHTICLSCSNDLAQVDGKCPFPGCSKPIAHAPGCNFLVRKAADCYFPDGAPEVRANKIAIGWLR